MFLPVNRQVEADEFGELLIFISQHLGEVVGPILLCVNGAYARTVLVRVAIHQGGDSGQFCNQIHSVLIEILQSNTTLFNLSIQQACL